MLHRSSVNLQRLLLRNYFGRFPRSKSPSSIANLSNQCSSYHIFKQPHHFRNPESINSATSFKILQSCRRFSVEIDREVDKINLKFAEAREEIESAMESKETVYFNEEADCARAAVSEVLELYEGLLKKLPEKERSAIQRAMGLKIEQLKAELQQLNE